MKHINLILSVLFWMVASVAMAITLPSTSYNYYDSYKAGNDGFKLSLGSNFVNHSTLTASSYTGSCTNDGVWTGDVSVCESCCAEEFRTCMANTNNYPDCSQKRGLCDYECEYKALNQEDSPLGETLLLLPFIAIYAVVRKRKENAEQA
jgi:hypothetical protein